MAFSNMKFAQCTGIALMELHMSLIARNAWPGMMS